MVTVSFPLDGPPTVEWVLSMRNAFLEASSKPPSEFQSTLPIAQLTSILDQCYEVLKKEPSLLEVSCQNIENCTVTVVGDTHGQFHDVVRLMEVAGLPSHNLKFVFNGDFVDRGSWGLETLAWLACWKIVMPDSVYLLRGNHESSTCTLLYGFRGECLAKYPASKDFKEAYKGCKKLFSALPLGAVIEKSTLVVHGGLFRRSPPPAAATGGKRRRKGSRQTQYDCYTLPLELGSLDDLAKAAKGGMDPDGHGSTILATDVMWSDPVGEPGLRLNNARGIGLIFGPDVTQSFLEQNQLKLIIRSHEGPDARDKRTDMQNMLEGYTIDHEVPAGKLMTVFSAPDYPQFQVGERYQNKAAVAVLGPPDYATPVMKQFTAALPRPQSQAFYDFSDTPDSDEDIGLGQGGGQGSDMSDWSCDGANEMEEVHSHFSTGSNPFVKPAAAAVITAKARAEPDAAALNSNAPAAAESTLMARGTAEPGDAPADIAPRSCAAKPSSRAKGCPEVQEAAGVSGEAGGTADGTTCGGEQANGTATVTVSANGSTAAKGAQVGELMDAAGSGTEGPDSHVEANPGASTAPPSAAGLPPVVSAEVDEAHPSSPTQGAPAESSDPSLPPPRTPKLASHQKQCVPPQQTPQGSRVRSLASPAKWSAPRSLRSNTPDMSPEPNAWLPAVQQLVAVTPEENTEPSGWMDDGQYLPLKITGSPVHGAAHDGGCKVRMHGTTAAAGRTIPQEHSVGDGAAPSTAGLKAASNQTSAGGLSKAQETILAEQVSQHNLSCSSTDVL